MASRVQVDSGLTPERLRPQASPVDRFVPTTAGRQAAQIAQGLSRFAPSLARLTQVVTEQDSAQKQAEGEQRARELFESGMSYKQAIEKGEITPDQSPWFRLGAKEFFGRNAANQYRVFLRTYLSQNGGDDATDSGAFYAMEREARKMFLDQTIGEAGRDAVFEQSFGGAVDNILAAEGNNFAQRAGANLIQQTKDSVSSSIFSTAQTAKVDGLTPQEAAVKIKLDIERARAMGLADTAAVNRIAAQSVINAAIDAGDETILESLDFIETSPGSKLSGVSDIQTAVHAAELKIADEAIVKDNREKKAEDEARGEIITSVFNEAENRFADNPDANVSDLRARLVAIQNRPVGAVSQFDQVQQAFRGQEWVSDPDVTSDAQLWLHGMSRNHQGVMTPNDARNLLIARDITRADFNGFMQAMQSRDSGGGGLLLNDRSLQEGMQRVDALIMAGTSKDQYGAAATQILSNQAQDALKVRYIRAMSPGGALDGASEESVVKWFSDNVPTAAATGLSAETIEASSTVPARPTIFSPNAHYTTTPMLGFSQLETLENEVANIKSGGRLSPWAASILYGMGVAVVPGDWQTIQEAVNTQKALLRTQPSTTANR